MNQIRTVWAATLVLGAGVACNPLAPDADDANDQVSLVITLEELDESAAQAQCKTPRELAEEVDNVFVTVGISGSDGEPVTSELRVSGVDPTTGVLELEGELSLELDPAVPRPVLDVALVYQGREVLGDYRGTVEMESGISVNVDELDILRTFPAGNVLQVDSFVYCIQSESVDEGVPFCSDDEDSEIEDESLTYRPDDNAFLYSYNRADVNWLDQGVLRTVRVSMDGGFEPVVIYRGSQALEEIAIGGGSSVVEVSLSPIAGSGPGTVGERLTGDVLIEFVDGASTPDRGLLSLERTVELSCDAQAVAR